MISVTTNAAKQIQLAAEQGNMQNMALRLVAQKAADGSFQYLMGFDDQHKDSDLEFKSEGIRILTTADAYPLLKGTVIDYVQLDNGESQFVFKNPNDPNYTPAGDGEHLL